MDFGKPKLLYQGPKQMTIFIGLIVSHVILHKINII